MNESSNYGVKRDCQSLINNLGSFWNRFISPWLSNLFHCDNTHRHDLYFHEGMKQTISLLDASSYITHPFINSLVAPDQTNNNNNKNNKNTNINHTKKNEQNKNQKPPKKTQLTNVLCRVVSMCVFVRHLYGFWIFVSNETWK